MKKSIAMIFCLAMAGISLNAQSKKQKEPPPPPPPKVEAVKFKPPVIVKDEEMADFYDRNPSVSELKWKPQQKLVVIFKDKEKKEEEYDISNETEENSFKEKYGVVPKSVAPPPPPPKPKKEIQ